MNEAKRQYNALYRQRNRRAIAKKGAATRAERLAILSVADLRARQASGAVKVCGKCKLPKSLAEFSLNRTLPDGFDSLCKICRKAAQKFYTTLKKTRGAK